MPAVSTAKMTARQYFQLGEDPPGVRLELVDGEIAVSPSPNPKHSYTEKTLSFIPLTYIRRHKMGRLYGDVDTLFTDFDVRRPDLLYFSNQRLHLVGEQAMEGPPDLCVEIASPSSRAIDRRDKFRQYAEGGVQWYWIVDPEHRTVEGFELHEGVYRSTASGRENDTIHLPPFDDLTIPLSELWQP
jgi:Uma2 family endonuclease